MGVNWLLTEVSKSELIVAMIRAWLRSMIGWDDVSAALNAISDYGKKLELLIEAQGREIEALKYQRMQREAKSKVHSMNDWERIQAEYAANPENFKEN